jgi:hypothetical protein
VAGWGLLLALISLGAYWVSRPRTPQLGGRARRDRSVPRRAVLLYENVNRLLPPAL